MSARTRSAVRFAILWAALAAYLFSFLSPFYSVRADAERSLTLDANQTVPANTGHGVRLKGDYSVQFTGARHWGDGTSAFKELWERCDPFCPAWLGHPTLWVGFVLVLARRYRAACLVCLAGLVFAVNLSAMRRSWTGSFWWGWDEVGLGYYLWVVSLLLVALAGTIGLGRQPPPGP